MSNALQQHCLHYMGIMQWEVRSCDYLLIINEKVDEASQQMLDRLLQALHWPQAQVQYLSHPADLAKIQNLQPKHILLFGIGDAEYPMQNIIQLPSLTQLLTDRSMKKQAWEVLQPLMLQPSQ
jgi:DNA polymerase III psi subunit